MRALHRWRLLRPHNERLLRERYARAGLVLRLVRGRPLRIVTATEETTVRSHPNCWTDAGHVCQEPSGKPCIEAGCGEPAGTLWGPLWCPGHDVERLERIGASLDAFAYSFVGDNRGDNRE